MTVILALLVLVAHLQRALSSSLSIDWTLDDGVSNLPIQFFLVDYSPPIGHPPPNSKLPPSIAHALINQTLPAREYTVAINAILLDGSIRVLAEKTVYSSPEAPILDSITTTDREAMISYFPPEGDDLSYYIEYFPLNQEEYANFVETRATLVKLRGLLPSTVFHIRVLTVYKSVVSHTGIDAVFTTKAQRHDASGEFAAGRASNQQSSSSSSISEEPPTPFPLYSLKTLFGSSSSFTNPFTAPSLHNTVTRVSSSTPSTTISSTFFSPHHFLPPIIDGTFDLSRLEASSRTSPSSSSIGTTDHRPTTHWTFPNVEWTNTMPTTSSRSNKVKVFTVAPKEPPTFPNSESSFVSTNRVQTSPTVTENTRSTRPVTQTMKKITTTSEMIDSQELIFEETTTSSATTPFPEKIKTTDSTTNMRTETESDYFLIAEETTTIASSDYLSEDVDGEKISDQFEEEHHEHDEEMEEYDRAPGEVRLSRQGKQLKVEWDAVEELGCDAYVLNYTTTADHKTYSIGSAKSSALIKMFSDQHLELKVFCMVGGSITKQWWAHRRVDLNKPQTVSNLRVKSVETDDFYVASVTLECDISKYHNFEQYKLVVTYSPGKTLKMGKDIVVTKRGAIRVDKLEPAQLYTFSIRNVSRELGLSSAAKAIRQVTAPIISSTVYPGQISSTAINVNFGDSDPEQGRFQYYELVFTGNTKNITKKLNMDDEHSFTFTRLIPGKTYNFELYTVYEGVRSRPVIANITTYPNKVNKFYPVIGRDYAVLYWDVENLAESDCRFRLSYSSTSNTGQQSTQTVELRNKTSYKFDGMQPETYYTFTVIVIMGTGAAEAESESESTTVGFSSRSKLTPVLERYSSRELAIEFENDHNTFTDTNGVIDNYAVIVSEDPKLGGDDFDLRSWWDVHDLGSPWPAYRASLSNYNPFKSRTVRSTKFIIGQDDCTRRSLHEPYCNGILRSNVNYQVKIRAYSVSNVAMETDWVSISGLATKNDRYLPCHMYLNGCPKRKSAQRRSLPPVISLLPLLLLSLSLIS